MKNLYSILTTFLTFLISFNGQSQCDHTFRMMDSWGDGWNGSTVDVTVNGAAVITGATAASIGGGANASTEDLAFPASSGDVIALSNWTTGQYTGEVSWEIQDISGNVIASGSHGETTAGTGSCAVSACAPVFGNYSFMYINNVDLISISNATGQGRYTDNTSLIANAFIGDSYSISGAYAGSYSMGLKIGFDWNGDAQYVSSEVVDMGVISAGGAWSYNFTVPSDATLGSVRVRVIATSNQYGTGYSSLGDDLCGTYSYGECEDYYLNVAANTGCSGTPSPGATTATVNPIGAGASSALGITTTPSGADITYQWEFSSDNSIWQTASGEVAATYNASPTSDTWYRCLVSCPSGGSNYSDPLQLTLIYCSPAPSSVDNSGITNVSFGSVNNATSTESGNYGDYSAQSGDISLGANCDLSITYSTGYTYFTRVWVDWNDDYDFDDANEQMHAGTSSSANPTVYDASFTVPSDVSLGSHRMRIGGADASTPTPCYTGTYASFEDYTINVIAPPAPNCASNLNPANGATDQAQLPTLTWDAVSDADGYDVYFGDLSALLGSGLSLVSSDQTATSYSPSSLSASTTYYWRVEPSNAYGTATGCATISFTTQAPAPTLNVGTMSSHGSLCVGSTSERSFTLSGINLTGDVSVSSLSGYTYSTTSGGSYSSSLTLSPSSGSVSETIYVLFTPTSAADYTGSITVSTSGVSDETVSALGTGLAAPSSASLTSDVSSICSGQSVNLTASATGVSASVSGSSSGTATQSGSDAANATATYTFSGLPSGATVTDVSVNVTSAGGNFCGSWYDMTTIINGTSVGTGCAGTTSYGTANGTDANSLVVACQANDIDAYADAVTVTFEVTVSYTYPSTDMTYTWSSSPSGVSSSTETATHTPTATTTYTVSFGAANGCSTDATETVTVAGTAPSDPTASVSGSSTINVGGTTELTASSGSSTVWYSSASGGSSVGTGSPWTTPVQCAEGSVTYYAEADNGSCTSGARGSVSFTVRPMVSTDPSNSLICSSGGSVTLSAQTTGSTSNLWSPTSTLTNSSGSSTVASPTSTTVYTLDSYVTGCGWTSGTVNIGVIDGVSFTPSATTSDICAGATADLSSNLTSSGFVAESATYSMDSPSGETYLVTGGSETVTATSCIYCPLDDASWEAIPIGFTYNFFGNDYTTVNVGVNGNIQFGTYNGTASGGLGDFAFTSFPNAAEPLNVIAGPAVDLNAGDGGDIRYWVKGLAPTRVFILEWNGVPGYNGNGTTTSQIKLYETTGNVEVHVQNSSSTSNKVVGLQNADASVGTTATSGTGAITNSAWVFIPGADYTFQWSTGGSDVVDATSSTYTTPALSTAGTTTYSVSALNPNTQCAATETVAITVNALPAAPNSSGDVTSCTTSGDQTLTVTTSTDVTSDWYDASSGGTSLATASLTYTTAVAGTYYAEAVNTITNCISDSRTPVTLNLNTSPTAPTTTATVDYCLGSSSSALSATADGGNTLNWYTEAPNFPSADGGTISGSAPTPSTSATGTTTYYVSQSSGSNSCESELSQIDVTINATPSEPVATDPSDYCQNDVASQLSASGGSGTLYWYTHPTSNAGETSTAPTPSTTSDGVTTYYVAERNDATSCEGARTAVNVTVLPSVIPSVTNSASSTSACSGSAITFTATPTNGGTPTYQWYVNGVSQSGEVFEIYTTPTVPAPGDEIYVEMTASSQTCLTITSAVSSDVVLLTAEASTPDVAVSSSDGDNVICPAESVTFSVQSSSNMGANPGYKWYKNGSAINGETNATYVSTDLIDSDAITLEMISSLDGACLTDPSATSIAVTTTVNPATSISSQPASSAACLGASEQYDVVASGTGTLTYQWMKDGSNITGNSSAVTNSLILSGIDNTDAAQYTVSVTGGCGSPLTSDAADLTISTSTSITSQPTGVTDCAGTTATFTVSADGDESSSAMTYQWAKDGSPITGENSASLAVSNIATSDAANYAVTITGGCGSVTSDDAQLVVNPLTVISSDPDNATLCSGNTANFSVTASGTGSLVYQWIQDGTTNVGSDNSVLSISNAESSNAGSYTVTVTGDCGAATSSSATLTVSALTEISTQPQDLAVCDGSGSTFAVVASGESSLTYQWKYGGVDINGETSDSYTNTSTTVSDEGSYSVVVTGGCGDASSNPAALTVEYASPITTTVGGSSVSSGADMRLDQDVEWTFNGSSLGTTGTANLGFIWDADESDPYTNYNWAWNSNPQSWSDNEGDLLIGDSRTLYVRSRYTNGTTCYSDAVSVILRKPLVSTSGSLSEFSNCSGTASSEQTFTVIGQYLTNAITVTAPSGYEVSKTQTSGYASNISFSPSGGDVSELVYVRVASATGGGTPSGDVTCSTTYGPSTPETVSASLAASSTVTDIPSVASTTDGSSCGSGTVALSATASAGDINWYENASGGTSVGSGTSFTTPTISATTEYYVDATDGSCITGSRTAVTASIFANPVAGSLSVDLTEALSTETVNWTNSGSSDGTVQYFYQWSDDNQNAPTGQWDAWDITVNQSWTASSAGNNMNRTLWVKTENTSADGCPTAETTPVATDVINCKENGLSATVSAGTVANLPLGDIITYTTGTPLDGSFERLQYQWDATDANSWTDWEQTNPYAYTTNTGGGQTLFVRSKISNTSTTIACQDYTAPIETFIIDCSSSSVTTVSSTETSSETEITCVNGEISVSASGAATYTWSDGSSTSSSRDLTAAGTYTVTGTFDNGCATTADIVITENTTTPSVVISDGSSNVTGVCISGGTQSIAASGADTYVWTDNSSTSAARDITTAGSYEVTGTTTANGCTSTATISADVSPSLTSSSTVTDETTCGEIDLSVSVDAASGSGAWTYSGIGNFASSTDASTTFTSNTFNTSQALVWTQTVGECTGSTATINALFNQPTTNTDLSSYDLDNECWVWGGLTNSDFGTASNWYKYDGSKWLRQTTATPGASDKVYVLGNTNAGLCVSSSNDISVTTGSSMTDLMVASGATANLSGSITVTGDITNNGTVSCGTSSITMNGASDQTFSSSDMYTTLYNMVLNKPSGDLIISSPLTVTGTLTMTSGDIVNSQPIIIGIDDDVTGDISYTSGVITGKVKRFFASGTGSKFFPVGVAGIERGVTVNFASSGPGFNQYLTAQYRAGLPNLSGSDAHYSGLPLITSDGQLIQNFHEEGYWEINPGSNSTGDSYSASINAKAYSVSIHMNDLRDAAGESQDKDKVRILKSAGSNTTSQHHVDWTAMTHFSVSGTNQDFTVVALGTGFSVFGAGAPDSDALPVELISFTGNCADGAVDVTWTTASEFNSAYFDLEKSRDGVTWEVINTQDAAGESTETLEYKHRDVNASNGDNYYRLTQVDIDGTQNTYDVINVNCSEASKGYFSIFPNPSSGSFQVILNNEDIVGSAVMNMTDTKGNVVMTNAIDVKSGINMYVVNEALAPGIYYISVVNGAHATTILKHSVR